MSEKPKKSFFGNLFGGNSNTTKNEIKSKSESPEEELKSELENEKELESSEIVESESLSSDFFEPSEFKETVQEVTTEDYQIELVHYQEHQKEYRQEKSKYDKILEEYEGAKGTFNDLLIDFSDLTQQIRDAKGLYNVDFEDYNKHKNNYEEVKSAYEAAKEKHQELSKNFLELRNELGLKQIALDNLKKRAQSSAQNYENQIQVYAKNDQIVAQLTHQFDQFQAEFQELFDKFEVLTEKYEAEKPDYDRVKDRYDFATQLKNDYQTLSKQAEQMQIQEEMAEANFNEIKEVRDENQDKVEVSVRVRKFTEEPLSNLDTAFEEEDQKFYELESKYQVVKTQYDEESANFARIKKNYEDLNASENANRVALHYITEEYNSAEEALSKVVKEYKPLNRKYQKEQSVYSAISKNFNTLKTMIDEAQNNVEVSKQAATEAQKTYDKVEEAYNYILTQNGILKQNLATKESQYKDIEDDYVDIVALFEEAKVTFDPLNSEYQAMKEKHDTLELQVFNTRNDVRRAQSVLDQSKESLTALTEQFKIAKTDLEKKQEEIKVSQNHLSELENSVKETSSEIQNNLSRAKELYALANDKYVTIVKRYNDFMSVHTEYTNRYSVIAGEHDKVSSLWRLADEEFEKINQAYRTFEIHGNKVVDLYNTVMKKYRSDKDYYDQVYEEYTKLQKSKQNVIEKKQSFDFAAKNLKTLLVLNGNLTFPIYEATGQNYVDSYNLPSIDKKANGIVILKDKKQLNSWLSTYKPLHDTLNDAASLFSVALDNYSANYESYRQLVETRLPVNEDNEFAYTGIELSHYTQLLEDQVASWQKEYSLREEAFTSLIIAYNDYLDRETQLMNLVATNVSAQGGVQTVINFINSVPDFVDMYSATYGDINSLAQHLDINPSELTKPKSESALIQLLNDNYYHKAVSLIENNLSAFVNNLNALRPNYEQVLDRLRKELKHFEISTGISTNRIDITGVLNDDIDLEAYLNTGLKNNYERLCTAAKGTSSIVNVIRKAGALSKVANRTIDTTADSTLVFPDKPISMSQELLNTEVRIYEPKAIPIPVQPDKPSEATLAPTMPTGLPERPAFIERIEEPEKVLEFLI